MADINRVVVGGNLTRDPELKQLPSGNSVCKLRIAVNTRVKDRDSGQSKGFAFVTMGSQAEAEKATSMFNGKSLADRALTVNTAKPREERRPGGGGNDRGGARGGSGGRRY